MIFSIFPIKINHFIGRAWSGINESFMIYILVEPAYVMHGTNGKISVEIDNFDIAYLYKILKK